MDLDRRQLGRTVLGLCALTAVVAWISGCSEDTTDDGGTGGSGATTSSGAGGSGATTSSGTGGGGTGGAGQGGFNPAEDPTASIYHPGDGECRVVNVEVPFVGVASDPQDGQLTGASMVWICSIDGQIGTGENFGFTPTQVGTHVITLTATDSDQNSGSDQISLDIQAQCN